MSGPFGGRVTRNVRQDHSDATLCVSDGHGYCPCPLEQAPPDEAELVCSDLHGEGGRHKPVLDLDFPCELVPSATPGHFHLYMDKEVAWEDYLKVLKAMAGAGLIEWGYLNATEERGFGSLRHPDRPKQAGERPY